MSKNDPNKDALVKSVGTILLGIIVLALVYNVFFSAGPGMGYGYQGGMEMSGGSHMGYGGMSGPTGYGLDFSLGSLLAGILVILVKLLSILLVVGLVIGVWLMVKEYLFADGENPLAALTMGMSKNKMSCPKCGSSVNSKWDFCPDCGVTLTKADKPGAQNPPPQG